jgi:hypothetical protein
MLRKQAIVMQQGSSLLWKETLDGGGTKAEADKCRLHPKNISMAQSMNVSKNYKKKLLSLCTSGENLECQLHVRQLNRKHENLPSHTSCVIISRPVQIGVHI